MDKANTPLARHEKMQAVRALVYRPSVMAAVNGLAGKAVGGWPETEEARRVLLGALPPQSERSYSLADVIGYYLTESYGHYARSQHYPGAT